MTLTGTKYDVMVFSSLYLFSILIEKMEACSPTVILSMDFWTMLPIKSGFATY